jgi:hypothetical protein
MFQVYESFLAETKACLETFYGLDARTSPSYARIVSTGHAQRLQDILNEKNGRIVYGGGANPRERYVEPTIIAGCESMCLEYALCDDYDEQTLPLRARSCKKKFLDLFYQ